MSMYILCIIF